MNRDVSPNSPARRPNWTGRGSSGDPHGLNSVGASVLPRTFPRNPGSGNMTGSIGLLPSPTPFSGRFPCCQAKLPRTGHTCAPTQAVTPVLFWHTPPLLLNTPFRRTCSVSCCWNGWRFPLPVTEATCDGCHAPLDPRGVHRAPCARSGRVRKRATPIERTLARVFREAGAQVRFNALLRDMNIGVRAGDNRRIKVLAQDLPCFGGAQLTVDVTLRSALGCTGEPQPHAADVDGAILVQARADKETTYPELVESGRCRLVVVAIETGGRWSDEAVHLFRMLAFAKARESPFALKWPVVLEWERRWTRMLATTCDVAFAASLVDPSDQCATWCHTGGEAPTLRVAG